MVFDLPRIHGTNFNGATDDWHNADNIILGAPLDITTTFRSGTRFGPREIRLLSHSLELYSPFRDRSLEEISLADIGDLDLPVGNLQESLDMVETAVRTILKNGKRPFILGGEHLLTWPVVKACHDYYPDLVIIDWDAHADMREHREGRRFNHGTVMNIIRERLGDDNLFLLGIRSEGQKSMKTARRTNLHLQEVLAPMRKIKDRIGNRPVYFTLDIDVIDPAYAPGTGAPEPGGITSREALEALSFFSDLNLVAMDLVEVTPVYDQAQITPLLAARLLRELLLIMDRGR